MVGRSWCVEGAVGISRAAGGQGCRTEPQGALVGREGTYSHKCAGSLIMAQVSSHRLWQEADGVLT